jgi:ABC-type multidrug transport system permease subunit
MKRNRIQIALVALLVLFAFAGCAPGPNSLAAGSRDEGGADGWLDGLWHGLISPITFIVSLFEDSVSIYEVRNNGNWYNFGFMLGMMMVFGGGGGGAARSRRRNRD